MVRPLLLALLAAGAVGASCAEERVVSVRGGLHGLPGAQSQYSDIARKSKPQGTSWEGVLRTFYPDKDDRTRGEKAPGFPNRRLMPDGSQLLVSRSPRDLIIHIIETLNQEEHDLLYEQVLSERTKEAYRERNRDPREAVEFLAEHKAEVIDFLNMMPGAGNTPGVRMETRGPGRYVLVAQDADTLGKPFEELEFAIEDGRFKLVMLR